MLLRTAYPRKVTHIWAGLIWLRTGSFVTVELVMWIFRSYCQRVRYNTHSFCIYKYCMVPVLYMRVNITQGSCYPMMFSLQFILANTNIYLYNQQSQMSANLSFSITHHITQFYKVCSWYYVLNQRIIQQIVVLSYLIQLIVFRGIPDIVLTFHLPQHDFKLYFTCTP
jgi:hypothetical protein